MTPENRITSAKMLIEKAMELIIDGANNKDIEYETITKIAIKTVKEEMAQMRKNTKVLITQFQAGKDYGSSVIRALIKRGLIQEYKFDYRDVVGIDGEPVKKTKGVKYFRVAEIEDAIEKGNVLNGTRRGTI